MFPMMTTGARLCHATAVPRSDGPRTDRLSPPRAPARHRLGSNSPELEGAAASPSTLEASRTIDRWRGLALRSWSTVQKPPGERPLDHQMSQRELRARYLSLSSRLGVLGRSLHSSRVEIRLVPDLAVFVDTQVRFAVGQHADCSRLASGVAINWRVTLSATIGPLTETTARFGRQDEPH
jgi:hypothetical protein